MTHVTQTPRCRHRRQFWTVATSDSAGFEAWPVVPAFRPNATRAHVARQWASSRGTPRPRRGARESPCESAAEAWPRRRLRGPDRGWNPFRAGLAPLLAPRPRSFAATLELVYRCANVPSVFGTEGWGFEPLRAYFLRMPCSESCSSALSDNQSRRPHTQKPGFLEKPGFLPPHVARSRTYA
jgi:hypothetical protein